MGYDFSNVSVLIVDDNQPLIQLTKGILDTFGIKNIDTAPNGEIGYEKFRDGSYDLLLVDWVMKPVNGIELTRRIRNEDTSPNRFVPIILMTGYTEKLKVIEARDIGVTEFLVKPFTAKDLYKRMAHIIERPRRFVSSDGFFGPDRRRSLTQEYNGPHRRKDDKEK